MSAPSPSPRSPDVRAVERLLGASAARALSQGGGSFALLGIEPETCTQSRVEAALQRQLDRVAQHRESDSPEADAVRVALHEAAGELLDPARRSVAMAKQIERQHRGEFAAAPVGEGDGSRVPRPSADRTNDGDRNGRRLRTSSGDPLITRMLLIGGVFIAAMIGLVVAAALILTSGGKGAGSGGASQAPAPGQTSTPTAVPSSATPNLGAPAPASTSRDSADAPSAAEPPDTSPEVHAPGEVRARVEFTDPALVIRELREAAELVRTDADKALDRFARAHQTAGDWWCRFDAAQVRAASDAVVEFVYRAAAQPDHATRAVSIIAQPARAIQPGTTGIGADEVWPAAWSAGLLSRLHRERDLPTNLATTVATALDPIVSDVRASRTPDAGFDSGAEIAMRRLPAAIFAGKVRAGSNAGGESSEAALSRAREALARWIEGVTLWRGSPASTDTVARERMLGEALGWLMTDSAEPESDGRIFDAISALAAEIKWRAGGPARAQLVSWFRDPRVSGGELRVLTAALATRSGAEGVDATMVLPMTAKGEDREKLRTRYAEAWGLAEASARADATRSWVTAAQAALAIQTPSTPLSQLELAAAITRLTSAAAIIWRGGDAGPAPLFAAPASGPDTTANINILRFTVNTGQGTTAATGNAADGAWSANYLAAERNIPVRLERLGVLESAGPPIGPVDAGVLAEAAVFASPAQVRAEAQRVVTMFADQPAMVSAMLDILNIAPKSQPLADTYARVAAAGLPRASDPDWEAAARRALVERLLGMLAGSGVHGEVERHAAAIADAYLAVSGQQRTGAGADASAEGALTGATALAEELRREAGATPVTRAVKFSLEELDRRRAERRAQAIGPAQGFVAEQAAIAELLGYVTASERPASEPIVVGVLDDLAASRRAAKHVFAQVLANERAMARVWLVRFGEVQTP